MKQLYIPFLITMLCANFTTAQLVEVLPYNGGTSYSLLLDGNTMYIGQSDYIRTFDITDSTPSPVIFASGISLSISMVLNGANMYVSNGSPVYRIMKLNTMTSPPTSSFVTENQPTASKLKIVGDYLYYTNFVADKIYRIDLTDPDYTVETVHSGIENNYAMQFKDNFIYVAERQNPGKLYKLDYTIPGAQPIDLASGLATPYDIEFMGDYLYISLNEANKIVRTNVTQSLPLAMEDVVDVVEPRDMEFVGDELYVIDGINNNHLSKFDTSILGVPEPESASMTLYPNPVKNSLFLSNIHTPSTYIIVDLWGRVLQEGTVEPQKGIEVATLATGRYFLKVENTKVLGFLKK